MQATASAQVHPIFQGILAGIEQAPQQIARAQYVSRLVRMDWAFEFADDARAYRKGQAELQSLRELQVELDADAEIWNRHAHPSYRIRRRVRVVAIKPDGERVTTWMNSGLNDVGLRMFMVQRHGAGTQVEVAELMEVAPALVASTDQGAQA